MQLHPACSPVCSRKSVWWTCDGNLPDAWPVLAYGVKGGQLSHLKDTGDAPKAWLKGIGPIKWKSGTDDQGQ